MNRRGKENLIKSLRAGRPTTQLPAHADDLLVFLGGFDSQEVLAKRCMAVVGSEEKAKAQILSLIDQMLLESEDDIERIFGSQTINQEDTEALKKRYQRLCKLFHPDRSLMSTDWLNKRMSVINKAHDFAEQVFAGTASLVKLTPEPQKSPARDGTTRDFNSGGRKGRDGSPYQSASEIYNEMERENNRLTSRAYYFIYSLLNDKKTKTRTGLVRLLTKGAVVVFAIVALLLTLSKLLPLTSDTSDIAISKGIRGNIADDNALASTRISSEDVSKLVDDLLAQTTTRTESNVSNNEGNQTKLAAQRQTESLKKWMKERNIKENTQALFSQKTSPNRNKPSRPGDLSKPQHPLEQKSAALIPKTQASLALSVELLPQLLSAFEQAFNTGSSIEFAKLFMPNGVYFGHHGRDEIEKERRLFFENVEKQNVKISVQQKRIVGLRILISGDMKVEFSKFNHVTLLCIPYSMTVFAKQNNSKYLIKKVKRRVRTTENSNCE